MGKTTNVAANGSPVRVILTVYLQRTKTRPFSPAPEKKREEVNPRLSVSGWGRVCMRGREAVALSVVHGGVNKHELP